MKNTIKFLAFLGFAVLLFWLSNQRNLSYAAAPYSNIRTSVVNTGYLLRTNDFGTNESFVNKFYIYDWTGTNELIRADGTNLFIKYATNVTADGVLGFNSTAYWTNITADTTINSFGVMDSSGYETIVLFVQNTAATNCKVTLPNGVIGIPGSVTPAVFTCTSSNVVTEIDISHYGNVYTNASYKN